MISRKRFSVIAATLIVASAIAISRAGERGVGASEGVGNFGKVSESLYRGAQPDESGIEHLKSLGVKSIISLRTTKNASAIEEEQAHAHGIAFTNVPLAGLGRPADEDVARVLSLIADLPGPVFIHCEHGCDRTGTIIACYRIEHDHWTTDQALFEAERFGISRWERGMKSYIIDFAANHNKTNTAAATRP